MFQSGISLLQPPHFGVLVPVPPKEPTNCFVKKKSFRLLFFSPPLPPPYTKPAVFFGKAFERRRFASQWEPLNEKKKARSRTAKVQSNLFKVMLAEATTT